jgi:cobalt-zinc-cadmium efflux system membrane fusion protein
MRAVVARQNAPSPRCARFAGVPWLVCVFLVACSLPPEEHRAAVAPANAVADMCREHGVLEALCTKHHPALIPVFQAKGDWCAEHGFPESLCPLCHPERGGRPAADVDVADNDDDNAPADGTRVTLKSVELAKTAGIVTTPAVERANGPSINAVARVVYDAARVALVNARAAGVVREVRVDVGARVHKGQALAVIESADVGADRSSLQVARARLQVAESTAARERELVHKGISAQKDLQRAEQEREAAAADVAAAESALGVVGSGPGIAGHYTLTAPLAGIVVQRNIAVGQTLSLEPMLFQIVDPTAMWAEIDVNERDLAVVAVGQQVELTVDALPARRFIGTIAYIAPIIDVRTRTAQARVAIQNVDGALRAQMFGNARIAVGGDHASVMVPREAVQRAKAVHLVFVKIAPAQYEARRVTLGLEDGDNVEIVKGIKAGDDVVTVGSFLLKTETLKDAIGAGCCD